jgi:hypothetical protein
MTSPQTTAQEFATCVTMKSQGPKPPTEVVPSEHGIWVLRTKSLRELGIDLDDVPPSTMASQWGQIPEDGGDCLAFRWTVPPIMA